MNKEFEAIAELFGAVIDEKGNLLEETFRNPERKHIQVFRKESVHNALGALILLIELLVRSFGHLPRDRVDDLICYVFEDMERKMRGGPQSLDR